MNDKNKTRKGLTLIELMVVLIIVVIVTIGFGASASRQVKRTNRETVVNELQVLASGLSDAYYDLGSPAYDPATPEGMAQFQTFLSIVSADYTGYQFDYTTLTATTNGFSITVADPRDVYEQPYECWFVTKEGFARYVIVACGGDDGKVAGLASYSAGNYSDDIVLMVRPKVN